MLAGAVFLLSAPGYFSVTDEREILAVAHRLASAGTFTLAEAHEPRPPGLGWLARRPGEPWRSRFLPLTSLSLAPLAWLDARLGWQRPGPSGSAVLFHGALFTTAALVLLAAGVRRGSSDAATGAALILTAFSWPVWQSAHRGGPEPVLVLLVAAFVSRPPWPGVSWVHLLVMALLPWTHPTGPLVAGGLLAGVWVGDPRSGRRAVLRPAAVLAASTLLFLAAWNHGYHGSWWGGGYALYYARGRDAFTPAALPGGLWTHLAELAPQLLVPIAVLAASRPGRWLLATPAARLAAVLTTVVLVFFAGFHAPEPARRLALAVPAWTPVLAQAWDRAALGRVGGALLLLAFVAGTASFLHHEGMYLLGPDGIFHPNVIWVRAAIEGRAGQAMAAALALGTLAVVAAARLAHPRGEPSAR